MKRLISLVCGSLVLLVMFLSPGNAVQAEEHDDCGCPGTVITGAERNKLVANLLKSDVFKQTRVDLKKEGYAWQGAGAIEVRELAPSMIVYQVVFLDETGVKIGAAYGSMSGPIEYLDYLAPIDEEHTH